MRRELPGEAPDPAGVQLDATLGLVDPARRTPPAEPGNRKVALATPATADFLASLDDLVDDHGDDPVDLGRYGGGDEGGQTTVRALRHRFPGAMNAVTGWRGTRDRLPLCDVWLEWNRSRPAATRDDDGLELVRAAIVLARDGERAWQRAGLPAPDHAMAVARLIGWLLLLDCPAGAVRFALDAAETMLAAVPGDRLREAPGAPHPRWRDPGAGHCAGLDVARALTVVPGRYGDEAWRRLWALERWVQDPLPDSSEPHSVERPRLEFLLRAHAAGAASDDDLIEHLLGSGGVRYWISHHDLHELSGRLDDGLPWLRLHPGARAVIERIRQRVGEVELRRGEAPTPASGAALSLRYTGGPRVVSGALGELGRAPLHRAWSYDDLGRENVLSHLIRCSHPGRDDTPERFGEALGESRPGERRLVELAAFAPQWAGHVEALLGWPGLASGAWWMHAHTKDVNWKVDATLRRAWEEEISERTPLTGTDLLDGAVDIWWFKDAYAALGPERWQSLDAAAKYCSTGGGHKRGQLFADAIRGRAEEAVLHRDIAERRHQDSVRALGLLPLPAPAGPGAGGGEADQAVVRRYQMIHEFRRSSRQFGPRRRESERRAADIALANLARVAGYRDPLRLSWAMEARTVSDLAAGPQTIEVAGVELSLGLDGAGAPELRISRNGAALASVPARLGRDPAVRALRARAAELRRQAARIRDSLEAAMIQGDVFTGRELRTLAAHPMLAPRLARLVMVGDRDQAGYPADGFSVLVGHDGTRHAVADDDDLRIAHPADLSNRNAWRQWQHDCVARGVVQPFKQVFRELYRPAADEWGAASALRYAGSRLQPRRGLALLGSRGWVSHPARSAGKSFHGAGIRATLRFTSEIAMQEDDALVLDEVSFSRLHDWETVPPGDVPPGLFSEVMRDIDLAVTVGGADQAAGGAETMEIRAVLAAEFASLLGLGDVTVEPPWIRVTGQHGGQAIHLGRGDAAGPADIGTDGDGARHARGRHRGTVPLPFADDDPAMAAILGELVRLARGGG